MYVCIYISYTSLPLAGKEICFFLFVFSCPKNQLCLQRFLSIQVFSWLPFSVVSCTVGITSSCWLLVFLFSVSLGSTLPLLLGVSNCKCARLFTCARLLVVATSVVRAAVKLTKVKSHMATIYVTELLHIIMISVDAQKTKKQMQEGKAILEC